MQSHLLFSNISSGEPGVISAPVKISQVRASPESLDGSQLPFFLYKCTSVYRSSFPISYNISPMFFFYHGTSWWLQELRQVLWSYSYYYHGSTSWYLWYYCSLHTPVLWFYYYGFKTKLLPLSWFSWLPRKNTQAMKNGKTMLNHGYSIIAKLWLHFLEAAISTALQQQ